MIKREKTSYRQIFKATSIFGGVQLFQVVIHLLKTKIIALVLGPAGIGLLGLLTSVVELMKTLVGVGLETGAVKELSEAVATDTPHAVTKALVTLRRCMWATAGAALLITLLIAPCLSIWSFGTKAYTLTFVILSIAVMFDVLNSGQIAALRGLRRIADLAKAKIMGAVSGLLIALPLFWIFAEHAIVLFLIITLGCSYLFSWIYARKIVTTTALPTWPETLCLGGKMAKLGIAMSLSSIAAIATAYLIKTYITHTTGVEQAGIYQAAFSLAEGYFGLIFAAMATDYFPRLAAANHNRAQMSDEVNKQTEIGLLIALPCIVAALFLMPTLIKLLYSSSFLAATSCMKWILLGNIFKIASWSLSYVLIATGRGVVFAVSNLLSGLLLLAMTLGGYRLWDVEGTGIAFFIYYVLFFIEMLIIMKRLCGLSFGKAVWKIIAVGLFLSGFAFVMQELTSGLLKYGLAAITITVVVTYAWRALNRRIDLAGVVRSKIKKS